MTTSAYAMAIQEKLNKERTWTERWKREDASTWEERALSREGHTGVVTDKRAYSPRVRTTLDFDRELRGKSGYRRPKLVEELPSGSTRFVVQPPATPRQPWTTRTWTPIALPPLAATPQPPAEPSAGDAKGVDVDTIHAHLRQLAKLFAHPQLGDEARHEFGELQKLLPTTTQSHFQPTDDFGRAVLPDRSRFRIKDKQVDYRENTLKTTGKILNCTFSLKYPSDAKAWIGKGPHYPKFDKAKA